MNKKIAGMLVTLLGLALLVYSGYRSLDFVMMTLPSNQAVLAVFALAALDGGLILWLIHFMKSASGAWQRGIALLMVLVDFLGAVLLFTSDTLVRSSEAGLTQRLAPETVYGVVLALSAVIALNIGAVVATHLTDPENRKAMASEDALDRIEEQAIKQISQSAPQLAAELAPQLAADWMARTRARYMNLLNSSYDQPAMIDGQKVKTSSGNGRVVYNAEAVLPNDKKGE